MELLSSTQSSSQNENSVRTIKNIPEKQKLNFSRSVLFHVKDRVSLKYCVNNCLWKQFLASK